MKSKGSPSSTNRSGLRLHLWRYRRQWLVPLVGGLALLASVFTPRVDRGFNDPLQILKLVAGILGILSATSVLGYQARQYMTQHRRVTTANLKAPKTGEGDH